jgi:dihydrofolate reductase
MLACRERHNGGPAEEQGLRRRIVARVIAALTMSVDGFIAHQDDSVGHLFDWYEAGDVEVRWPGMSMVSRVAPQSAEYLRRTIGEAGALVVGRRVYDYANGWAGDHPLGVPVFLVTHNPPLAWPVPDAPFTAVSAGVGPAIEKAKAVAGDKAVALAGPSIIQQALEEDLVDEIAIELAPVLLGDGIRFFGEIAHAPVLLDDPEVIASARVTHLRFRVRHRNT